MLDSFYNLVCHYVDIVFEKKGNKETLQNFSSGNKIPRKIRVLMTNKTNISISILKSKSEKKGC